MFGSKLITIRFDQKKEEVNNHKTKCMNGNRVNAFFKAVLHNPLLIYQSQILLRCVRYWRTKKAKTHLVKSAC